MATITGHAGAVLVAAVAINGKILGWKHTQTSKNIETTAAGDTGTERIHLNSDWTAVVNWEAPNQAAWDQHEGLVGTEAVIALMRKSGDTNPYFTGTGLIEEVEVDAQSDQAIKGTMTVKNSTGVPGTFDTTPAT